MKDTRISDIPEIYPRIQSKCEEIGFDMPSDLYIGTLLKTLIASKPGGAFLELGTGIGLSLAWMIAGMDAQSGLISIDNDQKLIALALEHFGQDERIQLVCEDGAAWLKNYRGSQFDLIFADAWPGKYGEIEEALALLKPGGFYVIDDMTAQPNWPEGHQENVDSLISYLENRRDLTLTKMNWSTGAIIAVKIATND
ncbi:Predicted O-methyltransferase YrrM [Robiginitalea myxolifaciens]|uniref:Predicted O-methyltransferase YrrM n=1 Tax=Robiginitalea myxolifaciens TaxID=400055 RepID=A0A1I6FQU1_9FLAO|nr:class I SAM-dependent methyltransferase [Robiginitalea myxolifaciens]SFR32322.1 Predicted O-methyltransferase YrrM [Robiginitalea myxolifaciens]